MLDLSRLGFGVKELVKRIEQSVIDLLAEYGIESFRKHGMPGVYTKYPLSAVRKKVSIADAKIAAIGLRVANHATYHGLSLNIDMDLEPFSRINPCGYEGLAVTQMRDCIVDFGNRDKMQTLAQIGDRLVAHLSQQLYGMHHG